MKKTWAILIFLGLAAILLWVGYEYGYKKPVTTTVTIVEEQTQDLGAELELTGDDGGAADFVELEKSAEGL